MNEEELAKLRWAIYLLKKHSVEDFLSKREAQESAEDLEKL